MNSAVRLRLLRNEDLPVIHAWPAYPDAFKELDHALRNGGWLTEFYRKPETWIYVSEHAGAAIAFSILSKTGVDEAEFRIALHPDWLGRGLGGHITTVTLAKGFGEISLQYIHLIVRQNNPRARRVYERVGFRQQGECELEVNGRQVMYDTMGMRRADFEAVI